MCFCEVVRSHRNGSLGLSGWVFQDASFLWGREDELGPKMRAHVKDGSMAVTDPPNQPGQKLSSVAFAPNHRLLFI